MNILFLSHRFPFPPNRGDRIRSYNIIKFLSQRHNIFLASVDDEPFPSQRKAEVEQFCKTFKIVKLNQSVKKIRALLTLPTTVPLTLPMFKSYKMRRYIDKLIATNNIDIIFIYCVAMAQYVTSHTHIPKVIDFIDCDSQKWIDYAGTASFPWNLIYRREGKFLRRYEQKVASVCKHAFVTSEREAEIFKQYPDICEITTVTNGISCPYKRLRRSHKSKSSSSPNLIFVGVMDYWPNIDAVTYFVKEIWPKVRSEIPSASFTIVGKNPTPQVQALADIPGVKVTGTVPNVKKYLFSATLCVLPLRIARGVQNKMLEAMCMKIPVVATTAASAGISARVGRDFLMADNPDDFAGSIIRLIRDSDFRQKIAENAYNFVKTFHDWDKNLKVMEDIMMQIVSSSQR